VLNEACAQSKLTRSASGRTAIPKTEPPEAMRYGRDQGGVRVEPMPKQIISSQSAPPRDSPTGHALALARRFARGIFFSCRARDRSIRRRGRCERRCREQTRQTLTN